MADTPRPAQQEFDSYLRGAAQDGLGQLNQRIDFTTNIKAAGLEEAADNFSALTSNAEKAHTAMLYLEQAIKDAAEAGDDSKVRQLAGQYKRVSDSAAEYESRLSQIQSIHGDEVAEVAGYRRTLQGAIEEENRRAIQKKKNLELAAKENELILSGQHAKLGLDEEAAKKKYFQNYNAIKAAKQEEKDQKTKEAFMSESGAGGRALKVGESLDRITGGKFNIEATMASAFSKLDAGVMKAIDGVVGALDKLGNKLDDSIKVASNFLKDNYTQINAALKGTDYTFNKIQEEASSVLGVNRFVLQTDYLNTIAKLSSEGISFNLEERALLETIKDKTLATFDANDAAITRLVRYLGRDVTTSQFGVEYALRNTLNHVFSDSSYINKLYDNVTAAIQDAALAIEGRDITPFNSTVSTWLGYMYEYGLSDSVVSKIAEGINYLGSGNVSALANNPDLQRLFLLSMDSADLNYADILQQGLDVDTTNILLKSVVNYLDEIVNNTKDNLVLQNSYANLFNMSITDMKAIHQLANQDINYLSSYESAINATKGAISEITSDTLMTNQIDYMLENAAYTYGFDIATDNGKYLAYKVSDLIMNVTEPFTDVKGAVGTVARAAQLVSTIGKFAVTALGLMSVGRSVFSGGLGNAKNTLGDYLHDAPIVLNVGTSEYSVQNGAKSTHYSTTSSTTYGATSTASSTTYGAVGDDGSAAETSIKDLGGKSAAEHVAEMIGEEKDWTTDDHDVLDILKEFEKTIMKSETSKNHAVAVSLEGLNDNVLTSFASIFADEDAMLKTYEGKNNVIGKSLFNYVDRIGVDEKGIKDRTGTGGGNTSPDGSNEGEDPSGGETPADIS